MEDKGCTVTLNQKHKKPQEFKSIFICLFKWERPLWWIPEYRRLWSTQSSHFHSIPTSHLMQKGLWGCFFLLCYLSFLIPHSAPSINIQAPSRPINWADNSVNSIIQRETGGSCHLLRAEHKNLTACFQCRIFFFTSQRGTKLLIHLKFSVIISLIILCVFN